jgi:hypothetical protein
MSSFGSICFQCGTGVAIEDYWLDCGGGSGFVAVRRMDTQSFDRCRKA